MISTLFKRKLSDEQLANVFVNGILGVVDKGFEEVKLMIQEDPAFKYHPELKDCTDGHFIMIVLAGNIQQLGSTFSPKQQRALEPLIYNRLAEVFGMEVEIFEKHLKSYMKFMQRVNHPSKVVLYSMSKAMFYKYKLNEYQEEYFSSLDTPNPLFLKRMDEVMKNFLWNWEAFFKRYRVHG